MVALFVLAATAIKVVEAGAGHPKFEFFIVLAGVVKVPRMCAGGDDYLLRLGFLEEVLHER